MNKRLVIIGLSVWFATLVGCTDAPDVHYSIGFDSFWSDLLRIIQPDPTIKNHGAPSGIGRG